MSAKNGEKLRECAPVGKLRYVQLIGEILHRGDTASSQIPSLKLTAFLPL